MWNKSKRVLLLSWVLLGLGIINLTTDVTHAETFIPQPARQGELSSEITENKIYNVIYFDSYEEAEDFADEMNQVDEYEGQIAFVATNIDEDYVVRASYNENAQDDGEKIYYLVPFDEEHHAALEMWLDEELILFHDLVSDGEIVESDSGNYHVEFEIRPRVNSRALFYNPETGHLDYFDAREPVTYLLDDFEKEAIIDLYTEAFPDEYVFEESTNDQGEAILIVSKEEVESVESVVEEVDEEPEVAESVAPNWLTRIYDLEVVDWLLNNRTVMFIVIAVLVVVAVVLIVV